MDRKLTAELVAERFSRAAVVKSNPVREVRTDGEFYYKLDRRSGRTFEREFRADRRGEDCAGQEVRQFFAAVRAADDEHGAGFRQEERQFLDEVFPEPDRAGEADGVIGHDVLPKNAAGFRARRV